MRATTGFIRLFIRGLAWDAAESGRSLADTLKIAARARLTTSGGGKFLTGTSAGGASVSFSLPPVGDLTADDLTAVCSSVLDQVDEIKAAAPGILDSALLAALLTRYPAPPRPRGIRTFRPDFSLGLSR